MQPFTSHLMRRLLAGAILVAGVCNVALAQDLKANLPVDPKVKKGKFANGLTYYIRPNAKPEKKVELRLIVNAGSILEDDNQQGLAHFMEHMNFNGTKNFQKNDLVSYLQSIGVEFGADLNAYTSFDETVYILPVPTDKPGNLDKGFQIIEDWAHNALLTDADIDGERAVVLEESRLGKGADMRMLYKYLPKLMSGSQYASRIPIGKDDILKTFKYDVVRKFYNEWYRPDLMAVAIVGDIDEATAMSYLKKHFEGMKNPAKERERKSFAVPTRTTSEAMVLTDKEATNFEYSLLFPSVKKPAEGTLGAYKDQIERQLITSIISRRLSDIARGTNPPFTYAYAGFDGWARDYENFAASATFGAGGAQNAINTLTAELLRAKQYGFTAGEVDLAKKGMMSYIEKAYNERTTTQSSALIGEFVRNFLENEPMPGIENEFEYYKQLLPAISVDALNAKTKSWMQDMTTFSLITGPQQGAKLPTDAELLAMTKAGFSQEVKPMEEKKVNTQILATMPKAGKVVSKEEDKELGTTVYTLSNGVKVTVKSTDFKSDEILFRGIKQGGTSNYDVADKYNVQFASGVVGGMGYGDYPPTELEKVVVGKTINVSAGISDINNVVNGNSSVKDLESMLQLAYLKLTSPRIDKDLFNAYKTKQKMQLQFAFSNPQTAFIDTLFRSLYPNQPLAPIRIARPEYFDKINPERAAEIYKNELGYADGYQFFIVGNIKQDAVVPLIETYLGGLPSKGTTPKFKDNGVRSITGVNTLNFKKGKEPKSLILAMYKGEIPYSEELELKAQMLTEVMNIKVIEVLREKMGGTYSGGFGGQVSRDPYPRYNIQLYIPCGPENVDKLVKAATGIIDEMKKNGPTKADLDKVKNTIHEQIREQEKENGYWVENLQEINFWSKSKNNFLKFDDLVNSISTEDIKTVANQLFNGKDQFTAVLNPES